MNVVPCSIMNPWAAPLITTSSAVGIRSASSSASPRGVRMSWLPTITSVGTLIRPSSSAAPPGRRGSPPTWAAKACVGRDSASGPSQPMAGLIRRNDRGPIVHRAAVLVIARIPRSLGDLGPLGEQVLAPRMLLAGGARERQRAHPVGMAEGEDLGDHAAHRGAHDVGVVGAGVVEHGERVVGHLLERVGAVRLVAAAGAAVVEGDRAVAARQRQALQDPQVLVGAEPLDHHDRRGAACDRWCCSGCGCRRRRARTASGERSPQRHPRRAASRARCRSAGRRTRRSSSSIRRCSASASSSSASGPRRIRVRVDRRAELDAGGAAQRRRAASPPGSTLDPGGDGGADQLDGRPAPVRVVAAVRGAEHAPARPARSAPSNSAAIGSRPPSRCRSGPIGAMSGRPTKRTGRPTASPIASAANTGASA